LIRNDVGVVAIGRNEGARLIECLKSARSITSNIVYVDSGSTDGSPAAAERLGATVIKLDLDRPFTAARARNEGFVALKVLQPDIRFVQFVDGDCELSQGWLSAALPFIEQRENVAVVCGRRRERYPEMSVYNRICDMEWDTPIGQALACGGDSLVRVRAFEAVDGFRPQLIAGEEPEFCARLREKGWRIWRLNSDMSRHDVALSRFRQWWVRAVRSGYGYAEVAWLHRSSPYGIYKRETIRAILWGGLAPLLIGLGALIHPAVLAAALIYPFQICRIAFTRGLTAPLSWAYALLMMLAKFAELQGILKFCWRRCRGLTAELIEYKQAG
jgi:GT2 family glycosyltransferase